MVEEITERQQQVTPADSVTLATFVVLKRMRILERRGQTRKRRNFRR
jgi:hypothetical protein